MAMITTMMFGITMNPTERAARCAPRRAKRHPTPAFSGHAPQRAALRVQWCI